MKFNVTGLLVTVLISAVVSYIMINRGDNYQWPWKNEDAATQEKATATAKAAAAKT